MRVTLIHNPGAGAQARVIDWNLARRRAAELLRKVGLNEDPDTLITNIGVGKQQLVEIAKALAKEVKLLILDEPTASLSEKDSDALLNLLMEFRAHGIASILISHKLNEVEKVADRITVLRDGRTIETMEKEDINEDRIITSMVGRSSISSAAGTIPDATMRETASQAVTMLRKGARSVFAVSGIGMRRMRASVAMPNVPSEPTKSPTRS